IEETLRDADETITKTVDHGRGEYAEIQNGRAHPEKLWGINEENYGQQTPIKQLAGSKVSGAHSLNDSNDDISDKDTIDRSIRDSDLGVNPSDEGNVLRVVLPELTEERRRDYIKLARAKAEDGRIAVRAVRRHAKQTLDRAEKDSEISKDENTAAEKRLDG